MSDVHAKSPIVIPCYNSLISSLQTIIDHTTAGIVYYQETRLLCVPSIEGVSRHRYCLADIVLSLGVDEISGNVQGGIRRRGNYEHGMLLRCSCITSGIRQYCTSSSYLNFTDRKPSTACKPCCLYGCLCRRLTGYIYAIISSQNAVEARAVI